MQCGCKRERHSCGAGCTCLNCCNLLASSREADTKALTVEGDEDLEYIMGWVFGNLEDEEVVEHSDADDLRLFC